MVDRRQLCKDFEGERRDERYSTGSGSDGAPHPSPPLPVPYHFEGEPRDEHKRSHFNSPLADIAVPSPGISPALLLPGQGGRIHSLRQDARADFVELSHFEPAAGCRAVYGQPFSDPRRGLMADSGRAAVDY